MKVLIFICLLVFVVALYQITTAHQARYTKPSLEGGWQMIGAAEANFKTDHDAVIISGPYYNFRSIKLKVAKNLLKLVKMVVTYDNGAPDNIEMLYSIPEGGESRIIDLHGAGQRKIKRIDFWYNTKGVGSGRADVTFFGMK